MKRFIFLFLLFCAAPLLAQAQPGIFPSGSGSGGTSVFDQSGNAIIPTGVGFDSTDFKLDDSGDMQVGGVVMASGTTPPYTPATSQMFLGLNGLYGKNDKHVVGSGNNLELKTLGTFTFTNGAKIYLQLTSNGPNFGDAATNTLSDTSSGILGGSMNRIGPYGSVIGGGTSNFIEVAVSGLFGAYSTIGGGRLNRCQASSGGYNTIGGGYNNVTDGDSGAHTVAGGRDNSAGTAHPATGYATVGGGNGNTAGAYGCTVSGGRQNLAGALSYSYSYGTIGGGQYNDTEDSSATVSGGSYNAATGPASTVVGGSSNTASGSFTIAGGSDNIAGPSGCAVALGGWKNTASSLYSSIYGGRDNTNLGPYSFIIAGYGNSTGVDADFGGTLGGYKTSVTRYGEIGHANGSFSSGNGTAQYSTLVLRNATADATPTELFLDGASLRAVIDTGTTWNFRISVSARGDGGAAAGYDITGTIQNTAGTVALVGSNTTVARESDAAWDCAATADDTNDALVITVTGAASVNVRWTATVYITQTKW